MKTKTVPARNAPAGHPSLFPTPQGIPRGAQGGSHGAPMGPPGGAPYYPFVGRRALWCPTDKPSPTIIESSGVSPRFGDNGTPALYTKK